METEETQIKEIFSFLKNENPEARLLAVRSCCSFTANPTYYPLLIAEHIPTILTKLLSDKKEIAHSAFLSLVNLSTHDDMSATLIEADLVDQCVKCIQNTPELAGWACILLANLTRSAQGQQSVLQTGTGLEGLHLSKIVHYLNTNCPSERAGNANTVGSGEEEEELIEINLDELEKDIKEDQYGWLGVVLSHVSRDLTGQKLICNPGRGLISKLIPSISCGSVHRRRGIAACVKNCCFEKENREILLDEKYDLIYQLLINLMGKEPDSEFRKEELDSMEDRIKILLGKGNREPDAKVKAEILDTMFLLSETRSGREVLRQHSVYSIVRVMDFNDASELVHESAHRLVQHIAADEGEEERRTPPSHSEQTAEHTPSATEESIRKDGSTKDAEKIRQPESGKTEEPDSENLDELD